MTRSPPLLLADRRITGYLDGASRGRLHGWVLEPANPFRRLTVEIRPAAGAAVIARADRYRADVHQGGIGDGYSGFSIPLHRLGDHGRIHVACIDPMAELGTIDLRPAAATAGGVVFSRADLFLNIDRISTRAHISGWAADKARPASRRVLRLRHAGRILAQQRATFFRPDATQFGGDGFYGFVFSVPLAPGAASALEDVETGLVFPVRP
jgi:hypothetical protein